MNTKSRPAVVGEKLVTKAFSGGTTGFAPAADKDAFSSHATAVCLLPGTEIALDEPVKVRAWPECKSPQSKVARFRQTDTDNLLTHHDALEFADGEFVKLTYLEEGQMATVLQLPAAPKTASEAKEQERLAVVG